MGAGLRPEAKAEDEPPDPTVRAQSSTLPAGGVWKRGKGRDNEAPADERAGNS